MNDPQDIHTGITPSPSGARARKPARNVGEPLVWLTAMGLSLGLAMVVALLAIIVANGTEVFWPKHIVRITVKEGDRQTVVAGEIVKRQRRAGTIAGQPGKEELQLFTGNKDVYGQGFRYLDVADIVSQDEPAEALVVERMEYGNAIGAPVRLKLAEAEPIPAADPRFQPRLRQLIAEVAARRSEILTLEDDLIGANSRRIAALELRLKVLARAGAADADEAGRVKSSLATLKDDYQTLAARARDLRRQQNLHALVLRLYSGEERVIPLGQVVGTTAANQLSWPARAALSCSHLWSFMVEKPREANTEGGIWPAIFGTFVMTLLMSAAVTPVGVIAAIYLREYARQGVLVRIVRIAVNNLAGVPSIVFGVFGLGFFVYIVGGGIDSLFFSEKLPTPTFGTGGILWSALTLALMTVPVVIVATEESVAAVPRGAREGSLACGASKWQTIQRVVLPAAVPGILTGLILAMARGAGEVAPLMLVGVVKLAPSLPLDGIYPFFHLDQKFMHLGFHIYDLGFQSPDSEAARPMVFATTLLLIALVMALNLGAIVLRERIRRRFATSAF
jgi:phosphate transport system permease protein